MSGEDRRRQLLEVAIDLFARKGFAGTTTREIAAAAGVTEAIIFRHFATKRDLYSAILDYRGSAAGAAEWCAEADAFMARNDDEGLFRLIVTKTIDVHREDSRFERLMMHAALEGDEIAVMHHDQINVVIGTRLSEYIQRRQKAGALRDCDYTAVVFAVAGAARFYAMQKYIYRLLDRQVTDEQIVDDFVNILMNGLRGRN